MVDYLVGLKADRKVGLRVVLKVEYLAAQTAWMKADGWEYHLVVYLADAKVEN